MLIHASQAIDVPSGLSDLEVASLVDAGATASNAVRIALERIPHLAVVVGAGPIGIIAAEMLRDEGLAPQIVQSSEPRRSAARSLGYRVSTSLSELDEPPDVIIDCVGSATVTAESIEALAPRGVYIAAGYATVPRFELPHVARKELTLRGVRSGSREDLARVMDLAAAGRVRLPAIQSWPIHEINEAFRALRERRVGGKAVIAPAQ
jgi:propanol-preferring alcohol dehydrogenase